MALKVLWSSRLAADLIEPTTFGDAIEVICEPDAGAALRHADWAEVLVAARPSEQLLDGTSLQHVVVPFAGIDAELRRNLLTRPRLTLHNSHANAGFVAQHAAALLLACANRVVEADRAMRFGVWGGRNRLQSLDLDGRRCLLLGYGAIGRALRPKLEGLGMRVEALRRGVPAPGDPPTRGPAELHAALADADAVVVSLPATPETEGLLDAEALAQLRPQAIVVNVGRGRVIDQHALYRALAGGRLLAAGLDVWWRYPDAEAERSEAFQLLPFHTLANVVASPHRSNQVFGWEQASLDDVAETLAALRRGEQRNQVDPARGY